MFNNRESENRQEPSSIEKIAKLFLLQASFGGEEASFPPESAVQNQGSPLEFASFGEPSVPFPLRILKLGTATDLREWFLSKANVSRDVPEGQFEFGDYCVNVRIDLRAEEEWVVVEPTVRPSPLRE